jgi:Protein of unknown function (DUF993)
MRMAVAVINDPASKVDGVKISLLSAAQEIAMRRLLDPAVKMYSGDDFNYPELIAGDGQGFSHALLGILMRLRLPRPQVSNGWRRIFRRSIRPSRRPSRFHDISSKHRRNFIRRHSISRLFERLAGSFHNAGRPAKCPVGSASLRLVSACRCGAGIARPRPGCCTHAERIEGRRHVLDRQSVAKRQDGKLHGVYACTCP